MRLPCLLLALALPSLLQANHPGQVLESHFPLLSSQATVETAAVAGDDAVFLLGDFTAVDGVPRPGLAKLTKAGTLDLAFAPETGPALSPSGSGVPFSGWGWGVLDSFQRPALFSLPQGRLLIIGSSRWELRDADGSLNETSFPDLPRSGPSVPRPQFHTGNRLYLIRDDLGTLQAYRTADLTPDPTFAPKDLPLPPRQAVPAGGQGLWVLGRSSAEEEPIFFPGPPPSAYQLYRLLEDGSLDLSFPPLKLDEGYEYRLLPRPGGGFRLLKNYLSSYRYLLWPSSEIHALIAEHYDEEGTLLGNVRFTIPSLVDLEAVKY